MTFNFFSVVYKKVDFSSNFNSSCDPIDVGFFQELLVQDYPPDPLNNLEVWSVIPVHKMVDSVQTQVYLPLKQFNLSSVCYKFNFPSKA